MTRYFFSEPLFALHRGPAPEIVVHGAAVSRIQGAQQGSAQNNFRFLTRSLLSPWHFMAAGVHRAESYWSLGLSFHSGQDIHMQALEQLSIQARAGEAELFCPREYPLDREYAARMQFSGVRPSRLHHPGSGKHLLILAACDQAGYEKHEYWKPGHPFQKKLFTLVGKEARRQVSWVYDSCGLPTFFMDAHTHLQMWERLSVDDSEAAICLRTLWLDNPRLIGGRGRLDSDLTIAAGGKALVKEGSDGLLIIQSFPDGVQPAASCLIKLGCGYNKAYLALALYCIAGRYKNLPPVFAELREYLGSRMDEWIPRGLSLVEDIDSV